MGQYLSKDEVLKSFFIDTPAEDTWELYFREGGRTQRVAIYYELEDCDNFAEEDALAYWMRVLKRTWDDEIFEDPQVDKTGPKVLKFRED